jgi:hypothetical protein
MNTTQKILAGFLAASATLFGIAHAQGPLQPLQGQGCDGPGSMRSAMMSNTDRGDMVKMMAQRADQRLEGLRSELKITDQQQPLWQAFSEKTKSEMGKGMAAMRDGADTKLSAPERMEKMQSSMKDRLAAMESVNESFKRLYASLSAEQKIIADAHFAKMTPGKHGSQRGPGNKAPQAPETTKG